MEEFFFVGTETDLILHFAFNVFDAHEHIVNLYSKFLGYKNYYYYKLMNYAGLKGKPLGIKLLKDLVQTDGVKTKNKKSKKF